MKAAIHQPHYLPWLGYMDKMAKADKFIILDEVQLTDRSPMVRNKFLGFNGKEEMLSLSIQKKGYREKMAKDIKLFEIRQVQDRHRKYFEYNYKRAAFYEEIMGQLQPIFEKPYENLIDIEMDTVLMIKRCLGIQTQLIYQSELSYERQSRKSDLMQALSSAVGADIYISGNGARKYMDEESFAREGIRVAYQKFSYPVYSQFGKKEFVPNLSSLDMLFHLGIEEAGKVFWDNVEKGKECI